MYVIMIYLYIRKVNKVKLRHTSVIAEPVYEECKDNMYSEQHTIIFCTNILCLEIKITYYLIVILYWNK